MAEKPEWAAKLSKGLEEWCITHRIFPRNKLADILNINRVQWGRISSGDSIVMEVESYGKIYLYTGLGDPRTIPPRLTGLPNGQHMLVERAWKEDRWQTWLRSPEAKAILAKAPEDSPVAASLRSTPAPIAAVSPESMPPAIQLTSAAFSFEGWLSGLGKAIDGGIALINRMQEYEQQLGQLTQAITQLNQILAQVNGYKSNTEELSGFITEAREVLSRLTPSPPQPAGYSPTKLLRETRRLLERQMDVSAEEREAFLNKVLVDLTQIYELALVLTDSEEKREHAIGVKKGLTTTKEEQVL